MYAIVPSGPFALETYEFLVKEWSDPNVEFVSLPGVLAGSVGLYDGQIVEAVVPDRRGMYSWASKKYVEALTEARTRIATGLTAEQVRVQIDRFLGKIYFTIRNRGLLPEERALNAAATNAFNFSPVIVEAGQDGLSLKDIGVEKSPLSRPGGDYYDVLLTFFDPERQQVGSCAAARAVHDRRRRHRAGDDRRSGDLVRILIFRMSRKGDCDAFTRKHAIQAGHARPQYTNNSEQAVAAKQRDRDCRVLRRGLHPLWLSLRLGFADLPVMRPDGRL